MRDDVLSGTLASAMADKMKPQRQAGQEAHKFKVHTVSQDGKTCTIRVGEQTVTADTGVTVATGDIVQAVWKDGRYTVISNLTTPSVVTDEEYENIKDVSGEANALLNEIAEIEEDAGDTLAGIISDSREAAELVDGMKQVADTAGTTLAQIVADADSAAGTLSGMQQAAQQAGTTLDGIYQDAADAKGAAQQAIGDADTAQQQAAQATGYANAALDQLGIVQDVMGVLDYAAKHGTFALTTDTTVQAGTVYFTKSGDDYEPVVSPAANPQQAGYYVLTYSDDTMAEFVMAHLAVTSRGLWVLPSGAASTDQAIDGNVDGSGATAQANANARKGAGYKVLLASDGMYVYDSTGACVAKYGATFQVGKDGAARLVGSSDKLQAFDSNGNKYFEVSASGLTFGTSTAATTDDVDDAISAAAVTASASGRSITTADAAPLPMLTLDVDGESVQDGTPSTSSPQPIRCVRGRNLANPETIASWASNITVDGDTITIPTPSTAADKVLYDNGDVPGQFTISYTVRNTGSGGGGVRFRIEYTDGTYGYTDSNTSHSTETGISYTTAANKTVNRIVSFYNVANPTIIRKLMLVRDSKMRAYIPYSRIMVRARGKNLLPMPSWDDIHAMPQSSGGYYTYPLELEPNTTYHLKTTWTDPDLAKQCGYILVSNNRSNSVWIAVAHTSSGSGDSNITTGSDGLLYFNVAATQSQYMSMLANAQPQLEAGSTPTAYEPYQEHVSYIDLQGEELHALDQTYRDVLHIDASGHAVIEKRCGVLFGDFSVTNYSALGDGTSSFKVAEAGASSSALSNVATLGSSDMSARMAYSGLDLYMRLSSEFVGGTAASANTYLNSNGVKVVYPLAAPETIDLGYCELPELSDGGTVHVSAEIQPVIAGSWWTHAGAEAGAAHGDSLYRVSQAEASIAVNADSIATKVSKDGVISSINQSAESVDIDASRIDIATTETGGLWVHPKGKGPVNGAATSTTTSWHMGDVLEFFKSGASWIKLWVESGVAKLRLGKDNSNRLVLDSSDITLIDSSSRTIARFGGTAQIGKDRVADSICVGIGEDPAGGFAEGFFVQRWESANSASALLTALHDEDNGHDYVYIGVVSGTFPGFGQHSLSVGSFGSSGTGAIGSCSIAVGEDATAGNWSQAFGGGVIASSNYQAVFGKYNVEDANGNYAFIIGNGTGDNARSNAMAVARNGDVRIGGHVRSMSGALKYSEPVAVDVLTNVNLPAGDNKAIVFTGATSDIVIVSAWTANANICIPVADSGDWYIAVFDPDMTPTVGTVDISFAYLNR